MQETLKIQGIGKSAVYLIAWFIALFACLRWVVPFAPEPIGSRAELFFEGAWRTICLSLESGIFGLLIGVLFSIALTSRYRFFRALGLTYAWIIQGTPLLVQIFFFYFALPQLLPFLHLTDWQTAVCALTLNVGAYNAQALAGGIRSIPRGQWDAAFSLELTYTQAFRWVIFPQVCRVMVVPLTGNFVALLKDSALVSSIGLLELTLTGNRITSETFQPVPILITVAVFYFLMSFPFLFLVRK